MPVTTHQVERDTTTPPRHEGQHADDPLVGGALAHHGLDQQAVAVGGIADARERHREAAFLVGVAPVVGARDNLRHLGVADLVVPSDADTDPGTTGAGHGLAHRLHGRPAEAELARVQDGLVADVE